MGEHYCSAVFSSNALSPATCHCTNIKPLIFVTRMCGQGQLSVYVGIYVGMNEIFIAHFSASSLFHFIGN